MKKCWQTAGKPMRFDHLQVNLTRIFWRNMARQISCRRCKAALPHILCLLALFCLLLTSSVWAQSKPSSTVSAPLITQAIDETRLVEVRGNFHPAVRTATDLGPASDSLMLQRMMLVLKRSPAQQAALNQRADNQKNSHSPQYHKWLTPTQFGAQFGATSQDISTITGWLQSHGFSVESVANAKNMIIFSGTNAQLKSAFHTTMHQYRSAPSKAAQINANGDPGRRRSSRQLAALWQRHQPQHSRSLGPRRRGHRIAQQLSHYAAARGGRRGHATARQQQMEDNASHSSGAAVQR